MGQIETFQQALQAEIGNLAQAGQRTIASIDAMSFEQASLREIAGGKNDELTGQIAAFSEDQKAALAAFGEDLQQAATDVASIARNQDHIENAVSSTCQESLAKLDAITDGQGHRGRQLDANEARANEMLANIGKLQQQVGAVLEMLNTCTQSLTDVLDSNNEQQFKLEGTVNQDLTAIADLISQIQANRASLEDQM
jgi:Mg2+ and Co2+ transporter CorA